MARGSPGEGVDQPSVSPEDMPRKLVPHFNEASIGTGIEDLTATVNRKYTADSATFAGDQLAQARVKAVNDLENAKQNAPVGDQTGFTEKFLADFDKNAGQTLQAANGNKVATSMLSRGLSELRDTLYTNTQSWVAQQNVAYRENSFYDQVKQNAAVVEAHPELLHSVGSSLTDVANAIGGDPSKRLEHMRAMDSALSQAAANGITRQDPRGALQALNDPTRATPDMAHAIAGLNDAQREAVRAKANEHLGDAVYSALDSNNIRGAQLALSKNEDLLDPKTAEQLQRTVNSQIVLNNSMAEKAQRDASNSLLKNAILMQSQGKLTYDWIEKNHSVWEPQAYEYARKLVEGAETKTDASTYLGLLKRQVAGEDVTPDVMNAASQGLLDKSDAGKLIEASGKEMPNFVKRGHDYIQTAGQVSQLEPDPAKAQTLANMQQDWLNLAQTHPEFAQDQAKAEAAYRGIVARYQLVAADKTRFTLDYPPYFPGTRMQPDLDGAKQGVWKSLQNGEISQDQFNRRAALIMQWQNVMNAEAQRKAAQAKAAAENQ